MPLFINKYSKNRLLRYIQGLVYVSLVAQLSVLPLQIYYFHQFSLHFLLANLVVIPLITVLIVTGISFLLFTYIFSPVAGIISFVVNFFTGLLFVWVQSLKQWDFLIINDINLNSRQSFLLILFLIGLGSYLNNKKTGKLLLIFSLLIVFQLDLFYTKKNIEKTSELIIPYTYKERMAIIQKIEDNLWIHVKDSVFDSAFLNDYKRNYRIENTHYDTLQYFYNTTEEGVLLILTEEYKEYMIGECADMILISGNIKINYSRLLDYHFPKKVIIHNRTPKWIKDKIIESCIHKNIPFHDMSKKGYFRLSY
jgi:competence protein ComEC